jgi:hypothetical protein
MAAEKKEAETKKEVIVHVDDLISFRQFSKKMADEVIDVSFGFLMLSITPSSYFD